MLICCALGKRNRATLVHRSSEGSATPSTRSLSSSYQGFVLLQTRRRNARAMPLYGIDFRDYLILSFHRLSPQPLHVKQTFYQLGVKCRCFRTHVMLENQRVDPAVK